MIIKCPQCSATYDQPASTLGKKVRCTRCQNVWRAEPPAPEPIEAPPIDEPRPAGRGHDSNPTLGESRAAVQAGMAPPQLRTVAADPQPVPPDALNGANSDDDFEDQDAPQPDPDEATDIASVTPAPEPIAASPAGSASRKDPFNARPGAGRSTASQPRTETSRAAQTRPTVTRTTVSKPSLDTLHGEDLESPLPREHGRRPSPASGVNGSGRHASVATKQPDAFWEDDESAPLPPPNSAKSAGRAGTRAKKRSEPQTGTEFADPYMPAPIDDARETTMAASRGLVVLGWLALLSLIGGLGAFLYMGRAEVVRALPGMAPLYAQAGLPVNIRGLEFRDVSFQWAVDAKGRPAMDIKGEVENVSDQPRSVPTVVFAFLDAEGLEIFNWATPIRYTALQPGKRTKFQARIPAPPASVANLQVRFAKARGTN
mgnify:CR=1 FL=1